jgi:hypothetical protein
MVYLRDYPFSLPQQFLPKKVAEQKQKAKIDS